MAEPKFELSISQADNGWIVRYGCATFIFEDSGRLVAELARYFAKPQAVLDEYGKRLAELHGMPMPPPRAVLNRPIYGEEGLGRAVHEPAQMAPQTTATAAAQPGRY